MIDGDDWLSNGDLAHGDDKVSQSEKDVESVAVFGQSSVAGFTVFEEVFAEVVGPKETAEF